jgi:tetratricopeptide (TPR) repeat protein
MEYLDFIISTLKFGKGRPGYETLKALIEAHYHLANLEADWESRIQRDGLQENFDKLQASPKIKILNAARDLLDQFPDDPVTDQLKASELCGEIYRNLINALLPPSDPAQIERQAQSALTLAQTERQAALYRPRSTGREIGRPIYDQNQPFYGRTDEQTAILTAIAHRTPLIVIHGRPGIGKTGLAAKLWWTLQAHPHRPDGMIYIGVSDQGAEGITVPGILSDFAKLFPPDHPFNRLMQTQEPPKVKLKALFETIRDGWYLLVLDNFETLQHDDHTVRDADLRGLFQTALTQSSLTILITSQKPLILDGLNQGWITSFLLQEGLDSSNAIAFLRDLDNGTPKILPESDAPLQGLIQNTQGFPRALEAAIALLKRSATVTLTDLLQNVDGMLTNEVNSYIVSKAIEALPPEQIRILEGLAVFNKAVDLAPLQYLLAPYLDTRDLKQQLDRLVREQYVSFEPSGRRYGLHSLDKTYCLQRIPAGSKADVPVRNEFEELMRSFRNEPPPSLDYPYTYHGLTGRISEFYQKQRKPQKEWRSLDDLQPQLEEFEYRLQLEDYDTAAQLLRGIDFDYLLLWGHADLTRQRHERLRDKIGDARLKGQHLTHLGLAYGELGQVNNAIECYEQALKIFREIGDRRGEGADLGNLAVAYAALGEVQRAIDYYQQQLTIAREIGDRRGEGNALGNLGNAYAALGEVQRAIDYYEQALKIDRELGDRRGEGADLGNLGLAYAALGEVQRAIDYYQQCLTIARETGYRQGEGIALGYLGKVYCDLGQFEQAIQTLRESVKIVTEIRATRLQNHANSYLARAYLLKGDLDLADTHIRTARQHDTPQNNHYAAALHGVIRLRQADRAYAQAAFEDAITHADQILGRTPKYYSALYTRALARAGLVVIRGDDLTPAQADYQAAMDLFDGAGRLQRAITLIDQLLRGEGGERLAPVRALLAQRLANRPPV